MTGGNADQKAYWEGAAAKWVSRQAELDATLQPVLDRLLDLAALKPHQQVLDIGCGTGASTQAASMLLDGAGCVTGADISEPMLTHARTRFPDLPNARFLAADVAAFPFEDGRFDAVISRFGTMFFADPVGAFRHIRAAMKPGAMLTMAAWADIASNPWFEVPMRAAKERLGAPPKLDRDAPGPLAFRDIPRVADILQAAGFKAVHADAEQLELTPPGDAREVAAHAVSVGPAARTLDHFDATAEDADAIASSVMARFAGYENPEGMRVPAVINFFSATA